MKHLSIEMLERYALRELSSLEQQRVENHVTRCPECLDRLYGETAWVNGMRLMDRMRRKVSASAKESRQQK
jgi:anti-sigma factor RsiW